MVDKYNTAQLSSHPQKLETRRTTSTSLELCMVKLDPYHLQLNSMLEKRRELAGKMTPLKRGLHQIGQKKCLQ